jgi:hypothetical protein
MNNSRRETASAQGRAKSSKASKVPSIVRTGDKETDKVIKGFSRKQCIELANELETKAARIRFAMDDQSDSPEFRAGCLIAGNTYLHLGLSSNQLRRLKLASRVLLAPGCRTSATAAWLLLNTALSHLEIIEMLMLKDHRTSKAQGNTATETYWERKSRPGIQGLN